VRGSSETGLTARERECENRIDMAASRLERHAHGVIVPLTDPTSTIP
jgi:hypothetical protein